MKNSIMMIMASLGMGSLSAWAGTPGQAGELALHKVERLVTLKKISSSFETQTVSLTVAPAGTGYMVMAMQGAAADGSMRMLHMTSDKDGRVATYKEAGKKDPASPLSLPGKNAVNLMELAMHCIESELVGTSDSCKRHSGIEMYLERFRSADLAATRDAAGTVTGVEITIQGDGLTKALVIGLGTDGTLNALTEK